VKNDDNLDGWTKIVPEAPMFLNHTYLLNTAASRLMTALGYPEKQREEAKFEEVLEDALHMIELGHRYLDAEDRGLVSRWSD
jgi:hypothetical protein